MLRRLWIHTVILAAVLLFLFAGVASATTHTVCVSGCDFTTIQAAENAAVAGDTVYVYNGTYTENIDVANASVSFVGEGRDVVTVQAAVTSDHVFDVTANYVNISGFNITGATGSTQAGVCLYRAEHCNISENRASNNECGFSLYNSSNNTLTSNNASGNEDGGISLRDSSNNTLTSNNASGNTYDGISLSNSSNNTLTSNTASGTGWDGIYLYDSCNNTLTSNNASGTGWDGIYLYDSCNNTLTSNIASGNMYDGISLRDSSNNTLTSNIASGNRYDGISLYDSCNNTLTSNNVVGNGWNGIILDQSSDNLIQSNHVNDTELTPPGYYDYLLESASLRNIIRNPADVSSYISLLSAASLTIANTDSSAFSEDSSADAKAYPNGNFSLHQSGVSEVIHIVQRDMSILPTNILTITSIPTWSTSGNHKKQWNITGTAGTFAYTIGDMLPDAEANITTDAGWNKTHTANATGYVTGTYDGGWSDQNFTITSVVGGIRTETKVPVPLFITLTVLMLCGVLYVFHARTHISRIFTALIATWLAFMLSQMIVSGNVVRMVSALDSGDTWVHDTVVIQIPALSYLLLFIGVILSIFLVKFVTDFGLEVLREAQREKM